MSDRTPQNETPACPACGASRRPGAAACWLCRADLTPVEGPAVSIDQVAVARPLQATASGQLSYSLATLMVVVTLVAIVCGVFAAAPGLGIPLAIVLLPVFVRTSIVVRHRETRGEDVPFATRALLFAGSFGTTIFILVVVGIASVGTFCGVCLGTWVGTQSEGFATIIGGIAATTMTVFAIWFSVRRIRKRWERDVGQT